MAERRTSNLERNELVSVLLRTLEYFDGVMFLTTNRVETIDSAFMSRIHLSIAYPHLLGESRREIWKTFLRRHLQGQESLLLDEKFLDEVSEADVNGRQIKNIVRVAHALADKGGHTIGVDDILLALRALKTFKEDFKSNAAKRSRGGSDDDDDGNAESDARHRTNGARKRARPCDNVDMSDSP